MAQIDNISNYQTDSNEQPNPQPRFEPLGTIPMYSLIRLIPELLKIDFSSVLKKQSWTPYETAFFFANMNPSHCFHNTVSAKRFIKSFLERLKTWSLIYQRLFREGIPPKNEEEKLLQDMLPKNLEKRFFNYSSDETMECGYSSRSVNHFFSKTTDLMVDRNEKMKHFLEIILNHSTKPLSPSEWIKWAIQKKLPFSALLKAEWEKIRPKPNDKQLSHRSIERETIKKIIVDHLQFLRKLFPTIPLKDLIQCHFIQMSKQDYSDATVLEWAKEAGIPSVPSGRPSKQGKQQYNHELLATLGIPI